MIDFDGYRPNVGIVICNSKRQVLWAKRYGQNSWQFPQGGINDNESAEQAMYRELFEEVGLTPKDVKILYTSKHWLRYKLPKRLLRYDSKPICIGQKQRWFLLQLVSDEKNIDMQSSKSPEFDGWRWVSFWYPVRQVVSFKKEVYRRAMKEFATILFNSHNKEYISSIKHIENEIKPHNSNKKSSYISKYSKRTYHKSRV
ncbi:RNA pyrophosphohydrolase [Pasteurella multocida]|uniref:RNA pyrophosphohydrolase n=1 Tax=Pasteurella dagmatis ATCC 43325 TaxID=667128 RepID=C9PQ24_9PAST|nr:RNA pyrophosphohydrolase [Pasteurella dagmatis]EEX50475.1 bis(5'-nucleosyl)-tetraphosphatase [Pasteurella dagmatis ATCC 43325]SNV55712.1 RNA pyrophosphohydrolase [Pasteurella dagmatis]VEI58162.1 RNA pyrophosphohydrolase [Pasteurella multocida]